MMNGTTTTFIDLVVGLTPPGRNHPPETTGSPRERSVLFALAYLADQADQDGTCSASARDLSAITHHQETSVRAALRNLQWAQFITVGEESWSTKTYRVRRDVLEQAQFTNQLRQHGAVELLAEYGLSQRSISALVGDGREAPWDPAYNTISELGEAIAAYRNLSARQQTGFHKWLNVRSVGEILGREIVDAYDAWAADQQQRSA